MSFEWKVGYGGRTHGGRTTNNNRSQKLITLKSGELRREKSHYQYILEVNLWKSKFESMSWKRCFRVFARPFFKGIAISYFFGKQVMTLLNTCTKFSFFNRSACRITKRFLFWVHLPWLVNKHYLATASVDWLNKIKI